MVLLEVEQKFNWTLKHQRAFQHFTAEDILRHLAVSRSEPQLTIRNIKFNKFRDTYYDKRSTLCNHGLWIRKRQMYDGPCKWQAKQLQKDNSFIRAAYEETENPSRILEMVRFYLPECTVAEHNFGLNVFCDFRTMRYSFVANEKFEVALDSTSFGHEVGEVELKAEDAVKAHQEIDTFMAKYPWFFDTKEEPKGKLTAYFEKYGFPGEDL